MPPPALILVSIVSIQLGAAVAIDIFPAFGPVGTAFLRVAFSAVLLIAAATISDRRASAEWPPRVVGRPGLLRPTWPLVCGSVVRPLRMT